MKVTAPDGRVWVVRRRLRRPRLWPKARLSIEGVQLVHLALLLWIAAVVGLVVVLVLLSLQWIALLTLVVLGAVVFGGRWLVDAVTEGPPAEEHRRIVRGLVPSRRVERRLADEIARGQEP